MLYGDEVSATRCLTLCAFVFSFNLNIISRVMWPFTCTWSPESPTRAFWNVRMSLRSSRSLSNVFQNRALAKLLGSINTRFTSQSPYCTVMTIGSREDASDVSIGKGGFKIWLIFQFTYGLSGMMLYVRTCETYF